ncbi:TetR family transcriptional regulator [Kibdelosporangium phytohabitans]|uniref:TetR family transcriptional regulator n=1 Tax=Kibdelosporangium phytohabitans TaxID=860235 RepID=UPI000AD7988B|nr:TetR family transcriptional regulator [Kibdelosporangium phytohabitans]MBE1469974.1 AcrR family transcriptional regulator [Kibdelosporangium phytohabitans]
MDQPATGLRERKKARTRTAIQQHALRLFKERGFQATTVEQIAEAAEVAPSTVFRYFPTKEDLAVLDDYYSIADAMSAAVAAQPPGVSPVEAMRAAFHAVFTGFSPEDRAARYERDLAMLTIPEVWAANLGLIARSRGVIADAMQARVPGPAARILADAIIGVGLGVLLDWASDPRGDPAEALDQAYSRLADLL